MIFKGGGWEVNLGIVRLFILIFEMYKMFGLFLVYIMQIYKGFFVDFLGVLNKMKRILMGEILVRLYNFC